jgi:hypothetical protein
MRRVALAKSSKVLVVLTAIAVAGMVTGCSGRSGSLFGKGKDAGAGYGE